MYSLRWEKRIIEYPCPRYIDSAGHYFRGIIVGEDIYWGVVNGEDEFVMPDQQLGYNPWSRERLPQTVRELEDTIAAQDRERKW